MKKDTYAAVLRAGRGIGIHGGAAVRAFERKSVPRKGDSQEIFEAALNLNGHVPTEKEQHGIGEP